MNSSIDQTDRVRHPLEFTGKGGEYFGIWIVNLFFSVLTLGIYSAWAKVTAILKLMATVFAI